MKLRIAANTAPKTNRNKLGGQSPIPQDLFGRFESQTGCSSDFIITSALLRIAALLYPLKPGCKVELQGEVLEPALFAELLLAFSDSGCETSIHKDCCSVRKA